MIIMFRYLFLIDLPDQTQLNKEKKKERKPDFLFILYFFWINIYIIQKFLHIFCNYFILYKKKYI